MGTPERSTFAKHFDKPLVRRPEWDATIRSHHREERARRRLMARTQAFPLNARARMATK